MTKDDVLLGWLVITRFMNVQEDSGSIRSPMHIIEAHVAKGWIRLTDRETYELTDAGEDVTDLAAAEWGIDALAGSFESSD